jgi:hypothetical protein
VAVSTLDDLLAEPSGVRGRRVFVRADLNVPLPGGRVGDDTRIRAALGTLRRLLAGGARVVLASHLGRPKGASKPELSLRPVAERLAELLGRPVAFAPECIGPGAEAAVAKLRDGELLLLENLRFHEEEEKNDPAFARQLAARVRLGCLEMPDPSPLSIFEQVYEEITPELVEQRDQRGSERARSACCAEFLAGRTDKRACHAEGKTVGDALRHERQRDHQPAAIYLRGLSHRGPNACSMCALRSPNRSVSMRRSLNRHTPSTLANRS